LIGQDRRRWLVISNRFAEGEGERERVVTIDVGVHRRVEVFVLAVFRSRMKVGRDDAVAYH
jgi:hypothetical protein